MIKNCNFLVVADHEQCIHLYGYDKEPDASCGVVVKDAIVEIYDKGLIIINGVRIFREWVSSYDYITEIEAKDKGLVYTKEDLVDEGWFRPKIVLKGGKYYRCSKQQKFELSSNKKYTFKNYTTVV